MERHSGNHQALHERRRHPARHGGSPFPPTPLQQQSGRCARKGNEPPEKQAGAGSRCGRTQKIFHRQRLVPDRGLPPLVKESGAYEEQQVPQQQKPNCQHCIGPAAGSGSG
jgi:hypothetical protein